MKKSLFIAALATVALASCSNDEVLEMKQDQIKFTAVAGKVSRGTEVTASTLKSFNVWGWVEQTGTGDANYETLYFSNVAFTGTAVTPATDPVTYTNPYTSEIPYWWPTGAMKFYALNYFDTANGVTLDEEDFSTGKFSFFVNSTVADQKDLLYAAQIGVSKADANQNGLPLNFRHALSQIEFNVGLDEVVPLEVVITSIAVKNLDGSATFTMPEMSTIPYYNDDPYKEEKEGVQVQVSTENDGSWGEWSDNDNDIPAVSYTITESATIRNDKFEEADEVTDGFVPYGGTDAERMFLIPQPLDGSSIVVNCDIWAKGENKVKVHSGELTYDFADGAEWKQGMKYVYNLKFGVTSLQQIKFSVTVDKYQTATGDPIEVK